MESIRSFFAPYPLALLVHVLAASLLIGSSVVMPLAQRALVRAGSRREFASWLTFMRDATRWHPVAALVLLITGLVMGTYSSFWTDGWFLVAIAGWVAAATIASRYLDGAMAAMTAALARHAGDTGGPDAPDTLGADLDALRRAPSMTYAQDALRALDIALLYLMFNKPTLADSVAVVVAAGLLAVAARLALNARAQRPLQDVALSAGHPR